MGKKSIEIKYQESKTLRQATYRHRALGLLRKAHEIGVLCGIKISLVFTNLKGDVINYSNNPDILVLAKDSFNQVLKSFQVEQFKPSSVSEPFTSLLEVSLQSQKSLQYIHQFN